MVVKRNDMKSEKRENMRGGDGTVTITHFDTSDNMKNCRLCCEILIPPGASIGEHEHKSETEYYIVIEGDGIVTDNGNDVQVKAGEVVITPDGSTHSIKNSGNSNLKMIAVIVTY